MAASDPACELRRIVQCLFNEGTPKDELYSELEKLLFDVRANPNQRISVDMVLGVMDALEGWLHPAAEVS